MSVEAEVMLNARVLAEIHELEYYREQALAAGNRKEYDRLSSQIQVCLQAREEVINRMKREKQMEELIKAENKRLKEEEKKKKGFFSRLFNL